MAGFDASNFLLNPPSSSLLNGHTGVETASPMAELLNPSFRYGALANALLGAPAQIQKRKAYFSFHFGDIMRVNAVRQAWKISHPDAPQMRSFYDSSLWESRQLEKPESLKGLIREGVEYTSAICVLVGSQTWSRRWVRYEIARAVTDGRGLLAVHLNNIRHHVSKAIDAWGANPLEYVAVGKVQPHPLLNAQYYLFEFTVQNGQSGWFRYADYTDPVKLPPYLSDPPAGFVMPLARGTMLYDHVLHEGHKNIGAWMDLAAQKAGR
jgi:MTH538 TIR-like domain (DUF1863)